MNKDLLTKQMKRKSECDEIKGKANKSRVGETWKNTEKRAMRSVENEKATKAAEGIHSGSKMVCKARKVWNS